MNNNILKIISIALIIATMIALSIAKCIWPTIEITLINNTLIQLMAAIGVFHIATPKDPNTK